MKKRIGRVIEIFIPNEYKNNNLLDIMTRTKIGFKVMLEDRIIEIIEEQNDLNTQIMKNDLVIINNQNISGKDFVNIELYEGEFYE